ncbi:MAG: hypothetical protein Fur0046_10590 [Cyanobacteria bacterium J069]|nr:MAG: hypothetical protein D6742_07990 [Cyanobacteria bacterium J069]
MGTANSIHFPKKFLKSGYFIRSRLGWVAKSALVVPLGLVSMPPAAAYDMAYGMAYDMTAIATLPPLIPPLIPLLATVELPTPPATPPAQPQFLPNFPSFNSQRLDHQIRLYSHYVMTEGTPDVLIIGSSRALQGVDPNALRQALTERGQPNLRIYNFSINGATARVMDVLVRRILPPDRLPRLIIWADGLRAFNSAKTDVTFNGIAASAGYRQLAAGARTIPPEPPPVALVNAEQPPEICLEIPPVPVLAKPPAAPAAPVEPVRQATSRLEQKEEKALAQSPETPPIPGSAGSSLGVDGNPVFLDFQTTLTPLATEVDSAAARLTFLGEALLDPGPVCLSFLEPTLPAPSQVAAVVPLPDPPANSGLRPDGFEAIATQFNPATYYRQFPRVAGQYDSNYTPFQLSGVQAQATVAIAQYARNRRIPLVFVSLPLTQDYLDPVRRRREQQFRQHMQQLATQHQFLFRDLSLLWPTRNQNFADPSHLNQEGARAVARHLAQDPSIPWPTP